MPTLSGRIARWLIQLNKFDITVIPPKGIRAKPYQIFWPNSPLSSMDDFIKTYLWRDMFSGDKKMAPGFRSLLHTSGGRGGGRGVVLYYPDVANVSLSLRLEFLGSNSVAEYEAQVMGSSLASKWNKNFECRGTQSPSSNKPTEIVLKESALAFY